METNESITQIVDILKEATDAQIAAAHERGLVSQSGDDRNPGRWIKDPEKKDGTSDDKGSSSPSTDYTEGTNQYGINFNRIDSDGHKVSNYFKPRRDRLGQTAKIAPTHIQEVKTAVDKLIDNNQHGIAAQIVVTTYGNQIEKDIITQINTAHDNSSTGIDPNDQRIRDAIVKKYEAQLNQDPDNVDAEGWVDQTKLGFRKPLPPVPGFSTADRTMEID